MNAADKIAGFAASAPLSRSTLRRAPSQGFLSKLFKKMGRSIREWGYGNSLYEQRLKGRHPVQLLGSPDDPAPGNAMLASAIYGGDLLHDGEKHKLHEAFWLQIDDTASKAYRDYAHSFHWLQDLAQSGDQTKARDAAETILSWWVPVGEQWDKDIWSAEILARRLINWLAHAPLIMSSLDLVYRSKVLHSMARQTRHLMRTCGDVEPGLPEIYTATALTLAGLLLPGGEGWRAKGVRTLEAKIKAFILPDGGTISHNPADAIRCMQLLILVRGAYIDTDNDLPSWVQITLDRLAPYVRAMRHADGSFAQIGGVSAEGSFGVDSILLASEAKGKAIENATHSGIQRIGMNGSMLIMDCSPPPSQQLSSKAHASTGSFEFSVGQDRLIVNMGPAKLDGPLAELGAMARSTAAHSSLIISDTNNSRIMDDGTIGKGVSETLTIRESTEDSTTAKLTHDGYVKRFGVKHERSVTLTKNGKQLNGVDRLFGPKLKKIRGASIAIRFHLHPSVEALKAPDGRITLESKNGRVWIFDVDEGTAEIEESLYLKKPDSPANSRQIVVRVPVKEKTTPICRWVFSEMDT
ncbi:heparinase II/III family protein [Kordiimonas laminariae]|uniref:heparinase II/III family protein n=1 Tax=Kordiimonas laminariae TaxID=2917717 RepID=UPI001FF2E9A9|nr:heparinase II/III family protein [Kordiimonas laminariae]MCK0070255.1 heparinase II/III family protein [Kordiimonas laminariae]